jgi:WD40 repeat protein
VVSGSEDQTIRVWDLQTGQLIHTVAGVSQGVTSVALSPSLQKLAATTDDDTIQLWDMESHQSMPPLISAYPVSYVSFSPDGQTLVTGSADGIRLWEVQTGELIRTIPQNFASLMSVAMNPNGSMLVSGTDHRANQVKIWDAHTGELLNTLEGHTYSISAVAFSPDGQTIYSGSIDESIRIWRSKTQAQAKCLESSTCSQVVAH